jgi:hypothetical protein
MKQVASQAAEKNTAQEKAQQQARRQAQQQAKHNALRNPYNIGTLDRFLRFTLGAALIGSVFYISPESVLSLAGIELKLYKLLPLIGIYPAVTAWMGWDPLYHAARIKSCTALRADVCANLVTQTKVLAKL